MFETVEPLVALAAKRRRLLYNGYFFTRDFPATLEVPGVGSYEEIEIEGFSQYEVVRYDRDSVGHPRSAGYYYGGSFGFVTYCITDWGDDSLTFSTTTMTQFSVPSLGQAPTRNAGDAAAVYRAWGVS